LARSPGPLFSNMSYPPCKIGGHPVIAAKNHDIPAP
jgi:hypothetical protein